MHQVMADIRCQHSARGSGKLIERGGEDQDKKEKQSARYLFILSHQTCEVSLMLMLSEEGL